MILTAEHPATNLYRVEVSGWDDSKAFFVENSELEWTDESGKQVTLNRGLSDGAVIFLRLLQPISNDRSHPVAYEAELVARFDVKDFEDVIEALLQWPDENVGRHRKEVPFVALALRSRAAAESEPTELVALTVTV